MPIFKPSRSLLNPKFEGYKLAPLSQEQDVTHHPLQYTPSQTNVSARSLVSFQEVQSRISHNHLTVAQNGRAVYIDGDLRLISVCLDEATQEPSFELLYELPKPISSPETTVPQREYPSAAFLDPTSLFVSDGYGYLYALRVPETGQAELLGTFELSVPPSYNSSKDVVPCRIHLAVQVAPLSAVAIISSKYYPKDPSQPDGSSTARTRAAAVQFDVWAVQFALPLSVPQDQPRPLDILWHRRGDDVPVYTAYDETRQSFMLVGSSAYRTDGSAPSPEYEPSPDELAPIPRAGENLDGAESSAPSLLQKPPPYSWTQTSDSVTVAIPLPSSTRKEDIKVAFSSRTLTLLVRSDAMNVDADSSGGSARVQPPRYDAKPLWDAIQPSTSLWTWDREAEHAFGVLSLHLDKVHSGTRWAQVFAASGTRAASTTTSAEDAEVPETLDPSELWAIREALEKYTAALRDGEDASGLGLGRGVPSLAKEEADDELDMGVGRTVCVSWVRADGVRPTYGHGDDAPVHLLSTPLPGVAARPSLVLKNGLDGIVYELGAASKVGDAPAWTHTSTYSALAFVLASKQDTRFTHHVASQAVLAFESGSRDTGGNVYIYRGTPAKEKWAQQAVLKIGGGPAGSLLGVGMVRTRVGKAVILCLCEGEILVLRDVL